MSAGRFLPTFVLVVACLLVAVAPVAAGVGTATGVTSSATTAGPVSASTHGAGSDAGANGTDEQSPPVYVLDAGARVGEPVTFATVVSATSSDYRWQFGDGTSSSGRLLAHTYAEPGNYTVSLRVGDESGVTNRTVAIAPARDQNVSYEPTTTAVTGPVFPLVSVDTNATTVDAGQPVTITATVLNVGTRTGTKSIELEVDSTQVADKSVVLGPGEHRQVSFTRRLDEPGVTTLTLDHRVSRNVTVRRVDFPEFAITAIEGPEEVVEGDPYTVEVTVANVGNATGSKAVEFEAHYRQVAVRQLTIPAGTERTIRFNYTFTEPGAQPVKFDHRVSRNVTVLPAEPNFTVTEVRLMNDTVRPSQEVVVVVTVSNTGHADGRLDLSLDLFGEPIDVETVAVPIGGTERVVLSSQVSEPGEYTAVVAGEELPFRVVGPERLANESDPADEPNGERLLDVFGIPLSAAVVLPVLAIVGVFVLSFTGWRP